MPGASNHSSVFASPLPYPPLSLGFPKNSLNRVMRYNWSSGAVVVRSREEKMFCNLVISS